MSFFKSKYFFDSSIALLKNKWLPFVLGLPLFFCLHHYEGIICDARLYLLQVINRWYPERFINDPPFMFGNQDSYGIFSVIYGFIVQHFHIDTGTFYFTFLGYSLWLLAASYFLYQFARKFNLRLWFLPLFWGFLFYSGDEMPNVLVYFFHYIEYFNCSRLFSIAVAILGIGFIIADKKITSIICFLLGTLIHPITAGWCLPLWLFCYYPKTRIPVAVVSALLPLTFLFHTGVFDIYPVDWGNCTRNHDVSHQMLYREIVAVLFFGLVVPRFTSNKKMLDFSKAVFWVLLIGFYWTVTGGVGKHIFIYQVQTWRVEWIFFILAFPVFVYLFIQSRFIHGVPVNTRHVALWLFGYGIFMPNSSVCIVVIALSLLFIPPKKLNVNIVLGFLALLCIFSAGLQELIKISLTGVVRVNMSVSDMYKETQNLLFLEFLIIIALIIRWLVKRQYRYILPIILLAFYIVFPQYQLIPILSICLLLYLDGHIKLWMLIFVLLLSTADIVFINTMRESSVFGFFQKTSIVSLQYLIPIFFSLFAYFIVRKLSKKISTLPLIACSIFLIISAIDSYDQRPSIRKENERNLEQFKRVTIFPQIKDRGKIFFHVHGEYISQPRFQFLTGAYFCETTHMGEPLFKGQYLESRKRDNYLFFKEYRNFRSGERQYEEFTKKELVKKDTLIDRVLFLCSIGEITHLVSNYRLVELKKQDSYKMNELETIYLYGCPNAKD